MMIYVQNRYKPMRKSKKKTTKRISKVKLTPITTSFNPVASGVVIRQTKQYQSLQSTGGSTTKPIQGKIYTGTAMIGIGTLHKSNAVPLFKKEDLEDQAKMRR